MGTAVRPAKTSPGSWDAFADVDAFVDEVLAELEAMAKDGSRPMRSGPKPPLAGAALRKAVMAIWCVGFCGMQWRAIGQLCEIPFGTLYGLFARWTRLGLWRRLLDRLRRRWRLACGDAPEPSAVVIDSRSCRSAPSCFERGIDGGKKIRGVKIHVAVDKYGIPLAIDVSRRTAMTPKGSCRSCARSPRGASTVWRSATSAIGANGWLRPVRHSASPSRPLLAAETDGSSRLASAGWLSARSPGSAATGG